MYVHLHGHSTFSFLEAIGKPPKIASRAKELEQPAVAITDYNGMFGTIKFLQAAKDEGIKAILGVELGFVLDVNSTYQVDQIGTIVILAQTDQGYLNLMSLISFANTKGFSGKPKIDINALKEFSEGIIVFFGGLQSWLGKMVQRDESQERIIEIIRMLQDIVGVKNVFLEVIAQDYAIVPELQKINDLVISLAQQIGLSCIVDNNYHYVKYSDRPAWEVALDIKDGKKIYDPDRRQIKGQFHMMSELEIRDVLRKNGYSDDQANTWIETNVLVADSIVNKVAMGQTLFPNYESPEDIKALYEANKDGLIVIDDE